MGTMLNLYFGLTIIGNNNSTKLPEENFMYIHSYETIIHIKPSHA